MRINFAPLAFIILLVLAMSAGFGFLLTPTEAANPSLQRAQATVTLMNADLDLALKATTVARQNSLADASFAPQFATATAIALDARLHAGAATATAQALAIQQRAAELTLAEREAALDGQRMADQMFFVIVIALVPALIILAVLGVLLAGARMNQDRRRSEAASPAGVKALAGNAATLSQPADSLRPQQPAMIGSQEGKG